MSVRTAARFLSPALLALVLACSATAASAKDMVSVGGSTVNMRDAPGLKSTVLWELGRGYPLQVTQRRGGWLKVKDFEGDAGWVARSLTSKQPHHVVKSKVLNVRSGPGTQYKVLGKAYYGDLLKTLEKRANWVRVQRDSGEKGWVSRRLVWGW